MLLGNLAQRDGFAHAGAGEQDVDPALFPLDRVEQTVEVVEIGRVCKTQKSSGFLQARWTQLAQPFIRAAP